MRSYIQYMVPLPNIFLTRLFSKTRLKRKDFREVARLPWAQEVSPPSFYDHVVGIQIEHSFYSSSDNRGLGLARI